MLTMIRATNYFAGAMSMIVSTPIRVSHFVHEHRHPDKCNWDRPVHLGNKKYLRVINVMYAGLRGETFVFILEETPKNVCNG